MLYAMKVINKKKIISDGKVEQQINERKILSQLNHPFIVSLHAAFTSVSLCYNLIEKQLVSRS